MDGDYLTQRASILSNAATSIAICSPVRDWRSLRDVADFNILLAAKLAYPFILATITTCQQLSEYLDDPLLDLFADNPPFSILGSRQYAVGSGGL
jgi:hypothetical protein